MEQDVPESPAIARKRSQEYEMARMWFTRFARFADSMPNSDVKYLPSCLTKLSVYNVYAEQMKGYKRLSRTQFIYHMWKTYFPNVHIPKVNFAYSYCFSSTDLYL